MSETDTTGAQQAATADTVNILGKMVSEVGASWQDKPVTCGWCGQPATVPFWYIAPWCAEMLRGHVCPACAEKLGVPSEPPTLEYCLGLPWVAVIRLEGDSARLTVEARNPVERAYVSDFELFADATPDGVADLLTDWKDGLAVHLRAKLAILNES